MITLFSSQIVCYIYSFLSRSPSWNSTFSFSVAPTAMAAATYCTIILIYFSQFWCILICAKVTVKKRVKEREKEIYKKNYYNMFQCQMNDVWDWWFKSSTALCTCVYNIIDFFFYTSILHVFMMKLKGSSEKLNCNNVKPKKDEKKKPKFVEINKNYGFGWKSKNSTVCFETVIQKKKKTFSQQRERHAHKPTNNKKEGKKKWYASNTKWHESEPLPLN